MKTIHHASAAAFSLSSVSFQERGVTLAIEKWRPGNMTGFYVSPMGKVTVEIFPYHTVVYDGNRKDVILDDTGGTLKGFLNSQKG